MEVIYDEENLKRYGVEAIQVSPEYPMLIDRFWTMPLRRKWMLWPTARILL